MSDFYTAEELGEKLGITAQTVKIWAREGKLPSHKFGNQYRFNKVEIDQWIEDHGGSYAENKDKK